MMNLRKLTMFCVFLVNNSDDLLTTTAFYEILQQQLFVKYFFAIIRGSYIYRNTFKYTSIIHIINIFYNTSIYSYIIYAMHASLK